MENWEDLIKKSEAEREARGADLSKNSWSKIEAYTAQFEYWKSHLKAEVDIDKMEYIFNDVNKSLQLGGKIEKIDIEQPPREGDWTGGFQGRGGYRPLYYNVEYGRSLSIPKAGKIDIVAAPWFDWELMARQLGNGKTSITYNVLGPFAKGTANVGVNASLNLSLLYEKGAKSIIAENIAGMKARGLI